MLAAAPIRFKLADLQMKGMPSCAKGLSPTSLSNETPIREPWTTFFDTFGIQGCQILLAEEKTSVLHGRTGESYLRRGFGHLDQLTVTTPRPVHCHNSDVKRGLKFNPGGALSMLGGFHHHWLSNCHQRSGLRRPRLFWVLHEVQAGEGSVSEARLRLGQRQPGG